MSQLTIRQRIALETFATVEMCMARQAIEPSEGGVERQLAVWEAAHEVIVPDLAKWDIPMCDLVYTYGADLGELFCLTLLSDDRLPTKAQVMSLSLDMSRKMIDRWGSHD